jgi:biotin carboxyl carrier protein
MESPEPARADSSAVSPSVPAVKRYWMLAVLALTFLFVLMPFLFWRGTWFGKPLTDVQLRQAMADSEHPRQIQHALSLIADRILSPDQEMRDSARAFYPEVVRIAESPTPELRLTAAWVMGQDNTVPEFHQKLLRLLGDANPMVRRNAALALVRFEDVSGIAEIRSLLTPSSVTAPVAGTLASRLRPGDAVNPGTLLGHIEIVQPAAQATPLEIRSDVPGSINRWLVQDGASVVEGQPIVLVDPSVEEVWEALRALYLVGQPQDLPAVEQILRGGEAVPANLRQQAEVTARAIRSRR